MARQTATSSPVSLFPFLAVLMCTIGALVLLLIMISARLRASAIAETVARQTVPTPTDEQTTPAGKTNIPEPTAPVPESLRREPFVSEPPPPELASADQLELLRELEVQSQRLQASLEDRTARLQGIEQKSQALRQQLDGLRKQELELQRQLNQATLSREQADRRSFELKAETEQVRELLRQSDELLTAQKQRLASPRYAIVPFDGQTGTVRQPIVIECRENSIRFVAEDITLRTDELVDYSPSHNPLLAGVRALSAYWTEQNRAAGRASSEPYALLLVRPDGSKEFKVARILLETIVGQYGYELIDVDFQYETPGTTPEAVAQCRAAIERAVAIGPDPAIALRPHLERSPIQPGASRSMAAIPRVVDSGRLVHGPVPASNFFESSEFQQRKPEAGAIASQTITNSRRTPGVVSADTAGRISRHPESPPQTDISRTALPSATGTGPLQGVQANSTSTADITPGQKTETDAVAATPADSTPGGSSSSKRSLPLDSASADTASNSSSSRMIESDRKVKPRRRWGIDNPGATLGLEQPIALIVTDRRVVIARRYQVTRQADRSSADIVNRTVSAIDRIALEWGPPPEKFYWTPQVTLTVPEQPDEVAMLLEKTLKELGVDVEVRSASGQATQ